MTLYRNPNGPQKCHAESPLDLPPGIEWERVETGPIEDDNGPVAGDFSVPSPDTPRGGE